MNECWQHGPTWAMFIGAMIGAVVTVNPLVWVGRMLYRATLGRLFRR